MEPRQRIINEILEERLYQTNKYSNTHDDTHTRSDHWRDLLGAYIQDIGTRTIGVSRKRLIQVAALCICIIESYDRISGSNRHG